MKLNTLVKPTYTFAPRSKPYKLCSFDIDNPVLDRLKVSTSPLEEHYNRFIIEIKNKQNKLLGREIFSMDNETGNIFGFSIEVEKEYRQKSYRFGEILRLASIIEMLENKLSTFDIYSKDTAVLFHSKYKFQPHFQTFAERDYALQTIIKNTFNLPKEFIKQALSIIEKIQQFPQAETQRNLREESCELTKKYIQQILLSQNKPKNNLFDYGMNMQLTVEDLKNNSNFFNQLFEKHNIEYKI